MKMTLGLAGVVGVASVAFAQTAVSPPPAAVITTSPDPKTATSPVAGANSYLPCCTRVAPSGHSRG